MKILTTTLCALICFTFTLHAQKQEPSSPGKIALAEELVTIMEVEKNMNAAMAQVTAMQEKSMASSNLPAEVRARQKRAAEIAQREIQGIMNWEVIKPAFVEIYTGVFTEDELRGMVDFFKTPMGRKWIEKQPQVQIATMQKMQSIMMSSMPKVQEAIKKAMAAEENNPTPTTVAPPKGE